MATLTFKVLGVEFTDNTIPDSAEAWDALVGPGSCLSAAISKELYHSHAGPLRAVVVDELTKLGYKQGDKESDGKFIERCRAEGLDDVVLAVNAQKVLTEKGITFAGTLKKEGSSRAAVGAGYIESAQQIIAAWESGVSSPEKTLEKMRAVWPGANLPVDPTNEVDLAKLLREIEKRQKPSFV